MPGIHEVRRLPYSAEQMFDLIEQVEQYPQFLPWCTRTQLIERTDEVVSATVEVGFRDLRVRVTTRNDAQESRCRGRRADACGWRFPARPACRRDPQQAGRNDCCSKMERIPCTYF